MSTEVPTTCTACIQSGCSSLPTAYATPTPAYRTENAKTAADAACCRAHRHFPGARKNAPYLCTKAPGWLSGGLSAAVRLRGGAAGAQAAHRAACTPPGRVLWTPAQAYRPGRPQPRPAPPKGRDNPSAAAQPHGACAPSWPAPPPARQLTLKSQFSAIVPPNPTGIVGPIVSP